MEIGRRLCAVGTAIAITGAAAVTAFAQPAAAVADELAAAQQAWLKRIFDVPPMLPVDPELREAGEAMAMALLARMQPILRTWVEEERAGAGASAPLGAVDRQAAARSAHRPA